MSWEWMRRLDFATAVPLLAAVLGVLLVAVGLLWCWRLRRRGQAGRRGLLLLVPAVLLLGIAGFRFWQRPLAFQQLFQDDFDDPARLAQLQATAVDTLDRPRALTGPWPQWRGPRRDGVSEETNLRTDWSRLPPVLWRHPVGGGYGSCAVADGRLFLMDREGPNERVLCLDAATGAERWVYSYAADYGAFRAGYATGPRTTPTVAGGRVYAMGALGRLLCLDESPADGKAHVRWQHDLLAEFDATMPTWGVACSPLVDGPRVIVQPGGKKGSIAAFDRESGQPLWSALSDPSGYSSPVAATAAGVPQIIALTGRGLTGLRPETGEQLWYFPWRTDFDANIATPIVAGNYVFISSDYGSGCALVELIPDGDSVRAAPVYVKRNKLLRNKHSCSVLYQGALYGFDVTSGSVLKCVDLKTGTEKWASRNVRHGSLLAADGQLFILSEDGTLSIVEATAQAFHLKARFPRVVTGDQCWAMPILADGRLYLRGAEEIVCLDVRKRT